MFQTFPSTYEEDSAEILRARLPLRESPAMTAAPQPPANIEVSENPMSAGIDKPQGIRLLAVSHCNEIIRRSHIGVKAPIRGGCTLEAGGDKPCPLAKAKTRY
jgi:hypothetical protein